MTRFETRERTGSKTARLSSTKKKNKSNSSSSGDILLSEALSSLQRMRNAPAIFRRSETLDTANGR